MPIRVHLVIASEMGRSVIGSALADDDDIELAEPRAVIAPPPGEHVDVVVVESGRLAQRDGLLAELTALAPVGIVSVDPSGTVDRLFRLNAQAWHGDRVGRLGLADAIREAAR